MTASLKEQWDHFSPLLQKALDREGSLFSLEDVWKTVQNGHAQFWPGANSAAVTEIRVYPKAKVLNVWLAGGEMQEIVGMIPAFKKFGSAMGCSRIYMHGRRGWAKVLNLEPVYVVLYENL